MKQLIKFLPERKRRTFLRFMNGKKKKAVETEDGEQEEEKPVVTKRTREELLQKIDQLKLADDGLNDVLDDSDEDFDDLESYDSEDFSDED